MQAPIQIFNEELYLDANGLMIPLETYMDRMDPSHKLTHIAVKPPAQERPGDVSRSCSAGEAAPPGIEDVEIKDPGGGRGAELCRASWTRCAAGASSSPACPRPCCSFAEWESSRDADLVRGRKYDIASASRSEPRTGRSVVQFLLEALVLAALGASAGMLGARPSAAPFAHSRGGWSSPLRWPRLGRRPGRSPRFASTAIRASALSPMEAMR